jgi:hypothetical protein
MDMMGSKPVKIPSAHLNCLRELPHVNPAVVVHGKAESFGKVPKYTCKESPQVVKFAFTCKEFPLFPADGAFFASEISMVSTFSEHNTPPPVLLDGDKTFANLYLMENDIYGLYF